MEEVVKKGWWARQSGVNKFLIVASIVGIGLVVGVTLYNNSKEEEPDENNKRTSDPDDVGNAKKDSSNSSNHKGELDSINSESLKSEIKNDDLPNNGQDCSMVITNFGRDLDYVKCGGKWFGKAKENPSNPAFKESYSKWTDLSEKAVVVERLNRRFPDM